MPPTAEQRFERIQVKIDRAKLRLEELRQEMAAFLAATPYKIRTRRDPATRRLEYYLADVAQPPVIFSVLAGETLQALRSALDHLAYQLVELGSVQPGPYKHVYFPICKDVSSYGVEKIKKTLGMRLPALAEIDALKPYSGGNDILWRLERLNNVDKHRLLITVGSTHEAVNVSPSSAQHMKGFPAEISQMFANMPLFLKPADRQFPLKSGDVLFTDLPDSEPVNTPFVFSVALNEAGVCEGCPLIETLEEMLKEVERLTKNFLPHLV